MSLSSDESEAEGSIDDAPLASEKRHTALRTHIEDTIDRLHGHALQIDRAGAKHRRERIEVYRQKEGPKWAYEAYKELANRAAKVTTRRHLRHFDRGWGNLSLGGEFASSTWRSIKRRERLIWLFISRNPHRPGFRLDPKTLISQRMYSKHRKQTQIHSVNVLPMTSTLFTQLQ